MRAALALLALLVGATAALATGLGVGGPGGGGSSDSITVATIGTQGQSVGFNINGTFAGAAVATGVDFQVNCSGGWTALSAPTITSTTWTSTAADVVVGSSGAGKTICVREQPSNTITASSNSFTVTSDALAINTPSAQTAGVAFGGLGGTWVGVSPTNVDIAFSTTNSCPGTGSYSTLGGVFTAGSPWSSTGTITISPGGLYWLCARKPNDTSSSGITAASFSVNGPTWNPSDNSDIVLSNGNLTGADPTTHATFRSVRSTTSHSSGKYYWEITCTSFGAANAGLIVGFGDASASLTSYAGSDTHAYGFQQDNNSHQGIFYQNSGNPFGNNSAQWCTAGGQVLAFALDVGNKLWWINNLSFNSGWNVGLGGSPNPATGTSGLSATAISGAQFLMLSETWSGGSDHVSATLNTGATSYAGTPPAGFGNW